MSNEKCLNQGILKMGLLVLLLLLSSSANAAIIARGDFQTCNSSQWWLQRGKDVSRQFQIVENPVRQGKKCAARFEVRNGDQHGSTSGERSEVSNLVGGDKLGTFSYKDFNPNKSNNFADRDKPGDDYYYAWSSFFPSNFPNVANWGVITQWHEATGGSGSVNLAVRVNANQHLILTHNVKADSNSVKTYPILTNIQKGIWHDFIVRVKWSCGNDGILQFWHKLENQNNYRQVVDFKGPTAKTTTYCNPVYKLQGFYRSANNTATHVIFHTGYVQTTTFNEAVQQAHGGTISTSVPKIEEPKKQIEIKGFNSKQWIVDVSSQELQQEDGKSANIIDGDVATYWVSRYSEREATHPHEVTVNLLKPYALQKIYVYNSGAGLGGEIKGYELNGSVDGKNWFVIAKGEFANQQENIISLEESEVAQFLKLKTLSAYPGSLNWTQGAAISEITIDGKESPPLQIEMPKVPRVIELKKGEEVIIRGL